MVCVGVTTMLGDSFSGSLRIDRDVMMVSVA